MARSLAVKIPTASLIADIEKSIAQIDEDIANYPAAYSQYKKDVAEYQDKMMAAVLEAIKNPANVGTDYDSIVRVTHNRYGRGGVDIAVRTEALGLPDYPEEPKKPNERESFGRDYITRKALLEKNLKVLRMTSQEEVNASTYNTVIDIL